MNSPTLAAAVVFWLFPYDWNFTACMCFGAMLSATDPVSGKHSTRMVHAQHHLTKPCHQWYLCSKN